jgi:protein tyrosine/serine phosphatase
VFSLGLVSWCGNAAEPQVKGLPNFHQVNEHIYRGGQPTQEGFKHLAKLGVKTVIDVRETSSRSAAEEKLVNSLKMKYVAVPMFNCPSREQAAKVLAIMHDESAGPVFIHCRRGADRTGTLVACYRISHDKWENEKALQEARSLGMRWWEWTMFKFVRAFEPTAIATAVATADATTK